MTAIEIIQEEIIKQYQEVEKLQRNTAMERGKKVAIRILEKVLERIKQEADNG